VVNPSQSSFGLQPPVKLMSGSEFTFTTVFPAARYCSSFAFFLGIIWVLPGAEKTAKVAQNNEFGPAFN
jgi:hypothetical protein